MAGREKGLSIPSSELPPRSEVSIFDTTSERKDVKLPPFTPYDAAIALYYLRDNEAPLLEKYHVSIPDEETIKKADSVIDSFVDASTDPRGLANRTRLEAFSALEKFAVSPELIATWEKTTSKESEDTGLFVMREAIGLARLIQLKAEEARKAEGGQDDTAEGKVNPIAKIYGVISGKSGRNISHQDGRGNRRNH